MSHLVAIAYPEETRAAEVMAAMRRLHAHGAIDLDDAAAVSKDGERRVKLEGATSRTAAGIAGGFFLGTLVGLVLFAPVIGALIGGTLGGAGGALVGNIGDLYRIDDFVLQVGDSMPPGSSAILMLVRKADPEKTLAELRPYGGNVIRTTLPDDAESRIRAALG
jgi:uncharacterized membrane protein